MGLVLLYCLWCCIYYSLIHITAAPSDFVPPETRSWFTFFNKSVQFSHSVMFNSLWPHGLQHARPPCPSPTPGVYSNSLSQWCHPAISSSVVPFFCLLQSFPASGSFQMSQFFTSGGQKYWSFSFSISPPYEHPGRISFRMDWLDLLAVQGTLKSLLQHHSSLALSFHYSPTLTSIHDHWENHSLD